MPLAPRSSKRGRSSTKFWLSNIRKSGVKADQVIADRAQQIEPILEKSAQKVVDRVSGDLDQKISAQIDEVRKAASDLAERPPANRGLAGLGASSGEGGGGTGRAPAGHASRTIPTGARNRPAKFKAWCSSRCSKLPKRAIQESLARLKEETAKYPAEFEQSCREAS